MAQTPDVCLAGLKIKCYAHLCKVYQHTLLCMLWLYTTFARKQGRANLPFLRTYRCDLNKGKRRRRRRCFYFAISQGRQTFTHLRVSGLDLLLPKTMNRRWGGSETWNCAPLWELVHASSESFRRVCFNCWHTFYRWTDKLIRWEIESR